MREGQVLGWTFLTLCLAVAPHVATGEEMPPVPEEAQDAFRKGQLACEQLREKTRRSGIVAPDEWDVAVEFFAEAQRKAPASPAVLKSLALAHQFRGANVAAKAWFHAFLAAYPQAKDRAAVAKLTFELEQKAQVAMRIVFNDALKEAERVPKRPALVVEGQATPDLSVWRPSRPEPTVGSWSTLSDLTSSKIEVMFAQADAGDLEGALTTGRTLAEGIRPGSWERPSGTEGEMAVWRRFSLWKAGHDALASAGDWAGAMALYAEHERAGVVKGEESAFHLSFGGISPTELLREIERKIGEGRDEPVTLKDWLALAAEASKADTEPGFESRLASLRDLKSPGDIVLAMAKMPVPVGRMLLRVRALEHRGSDRALEAFHRTYDRRADEKAGKEKASSLLDAMPELTWIRSSRYGETALVNAAGASWGEDAVELLLARGANPNDRSYYGFTALHYAAMSHQTDQARLLLAKGADVNAKAYDGTTPLHCAADCCDRPPFVQLLLKAGADLGARNDKGLTPLQTAERAVRRARRIWVKPDIGRLQAFGLTPEMVAERISTSKLGLVAFISPGLEGWIAVRTDGGLEDLDQLGALAVKTPDGQSVTIREVAAVQVPADENAERVAGLFGQIAEMLRKAEARAAGTQSQ